MSTDVVANIYCGLGNQLFQYAAALHVMRAAAGSSYELLFMEGHDGGLDIREFVDVHAREPTRTERAKWSEYADRPGPLRPIFRRSSRVTERLTKRILITQGTPYEGASRLEPGRTYKLDGYFQHPDWYSDAWWTVARQLASKAPEGFLEYQAEQSFVVHLRRGDYVRSGWDLSVSYYADALTALGLVGQRVVVVTDEPRFVPWFVDALRPLGCDFVEPRAFTGSPVFDDFWNAAAAQRLVTANSTFSWWAAAVASATNPGVQIAYPSPWLPNRFRQQPLPDFGLPGWLPVDSGLKPFL